jgi:hypothetical protein
MIHLHLSSGQWAALGCLFFVLAIAGALALLAEEIRHPGGRR